MGIKHEKALEFCRTSDAILEWTDENYLVMLVKYNYDKNTVLIFGGANYGRGEKKFTPSDALKYCGFYSKIKDTLYDCKYPISSFVGDAAQVPSLDVLKATICDVVNEWVQNYIDGKPEKLKPFIKGAFDVKSECSTSRPIEKAKEAFLGETKTIKLWPEFNLTLEFEQVLSYLHGDGALVETLGRGVIERNAKRFACCIYELKQAYAELEKLEDDKANPLYTIREISKVPSKLAQIAPSRRNVVVELSLDKGVTFKFTWDTKNPLTWSIKDFRAPERATFTRYFGKIESYEPSNIKSITFKEKTLYDRREFLRTLNGAK